MKKIGLTFIMFIALATFGVQAQGSDTGEIWRCFAPYDFGKNKVLVELNWGTKLGSLTTEEAVENLKAVAKAEGVPLKKPVEDLKPEIERMVELVNVMVSGQVSVAGVTHSAFFDIYGLNRRWDFGKDLKYAFIINPDGSGAYYDFSPVEEGETTKPSQLYDCVLSRSLSSAELPQWDGTQGQPRREKDLQKRPGRKRTADGWVYELE